MPVGSEIVGLVPKKAIEIAADFFLQLENFSPAQVFENKLAAALSGARWTWQRTGKLAELARPFLDAVASPTATPGGGSVSAFAGALAAALGQMVAALSRKKKSQAGFADRLSAALDEMRRVADELAEAIDRDAASYEAVMAAFKLPQGDAKETKQREESDTESDERRVRGAVAGGRTRRCAFRTPRTTGYYRCRIHAVRLAGSAFDGRGRRARSTGQRGDQSRRPDGRSVCRVDAHEDSRTAGASGQCIALDKGVD